ncbi:DUF4148 domain-containing protein [Pigmentiphaga litoralis]|uniref:DUF4148 domain-containing protein n=1 Tax=Pigmentiphaga litoralis TaxID=516702 RepID=A0A7Y9IYU9_9BURK|nr:DUF4148 domain-containing protein [Pigmentiphaga litoralis]NYE26386.1 hypothetical protein [Pigmentiphaga litoralis]NYE85506.1 hypothetical protein [Pigmentiphaga litoralis]
MKTTTAALLLALSVTGANAFADSNVVTDANYPGPFSLESNTTHAQVQAELVRARQAGLIVADAQYPGPFARPATASNPAVTREAVRAELAQARAEGIAFDDATYPVPAQTVPQGRHAGNHSRLAASGPGNVVTR